MNNSTLLGSSVIAIVDRCRMWIAKDNRTVREGNQIHFRRLMCSVEEGFCSKFDARWVDCFVFCII